MALTEDIMACMKAQRLGIIPQVHLHDIQWESASIHHRALIIFESKNARDNGCNVLNDLIMESNHGISGGCMQLSILELEYCGPVLDVINYIRLTGVM